MLKTSATAPTPKAIRARVSEPILDQSDLGRPVREAQRSRVEPRDLTHTSGRAAPTSPGGNWYFDS
jgi:hypothetical protein